MFKRLIVSGFVVWALLSCAGRYTEIGSDWTPDIYFKNAQIAMDEGRYELALYYYEVFSIRHPEDRLRTMAAEYERAFIYYRTARWEQARDGFLAIIRKYDESPYAALYHPRFRELSEIGLKNIEKQKKVRNKLLWRLREKQWAEENGKSLRDLQTDS